MRGSISKHIDKLVKDEEVLVSTNENNELQLNIRRIKKAFWKKLNRIERSKRTEQLRKG